MKDVTFPKDTPTWSCADFYSAVLLRASGIPLMGLGKGQSKFVTFYFGASEQTCEEILKKHWDRSFKLETRLFIETINELKTRVHEKMKGGCAQTLEPRFFCSLTKKLGFSRKGLDRYEWTDDIKQNCSK